MVCNGGLVPERDFSLSAFGVSFFGNVYLRGVSPCLVLALTCAPASSSAFAPT